MDSIVAAYKYDSLDHFYREALKGLPSEVKRGLIDIATNNETSFFRDKRVFGALSDSVIAELMERGQTLDIWSVASSTGQEVYSMAMLLEEWQEKNNKNIIYNIEGTDISSQALERARGGSYSQLEVQRGLAIPLLMKYFEKNEGENYPWQIKDYVKRRAHFKELNLTDNFFMNKQFNLVLCRNVLIYQNKERKIEILKRISKYLNPGGFLIMGSGETLVGLSDDYEQSTSTGAVVYKKKEKASVLQAS